MDHHPLAEFFSEAVETALRSEGAATDPAVSHYLTELLVRFLHTDKIFAIQDASGRTVVSVTEMVAQGDVRLAADSFERERQVHRHIGDFLLFWSGVYPEFLNRMRVAVGTDLLCDYERQGRESYHVVSTFDYPPFDAEAPIYRKLSEGFTTYAHSLRTVRSKLGHA